MAGPGEGGVRKHLSRREAEIMDVLHRLDEATVAEVRRRLPDPPSYNSVRTTLGILEQKGQVTHRVDGPRYVYGARATREQARRSALQHLVETYFQGSAPRAAATLLGMSAGRLDAAELGELSRLIEQARRRKRR